MFKHLLQVNNTVILNTKKYHIKQKQKLAKFIKGYHYAVLNVEEKWKFSYLLEQHVYSLKYKDQYNSKNFSSCFKNINMYKYVQGVDIFL